MNKVILIGRIANEIELRYTPNRKPVAKFNLAVDKGYNKEKRLESKINNTPTADFFNIVIWGKQAEFVANHTEKGKLIAISGSLQNRSYTDKEGVTKYIIEVISEKAEILEWKKDDRGDKSEEIEEENKINKFTEMPRKA